MKKTFKIFGLTLTMTMLAVSLAACGNSSSKHDSSTKEATTQKVKKKSSTEVASLSSSTATSVMDSSASKSSVTSMSSSSSMTSKIPTSVTPQQMGIILAMDQEPVVIDEYLGKCLWFGVDNESNGPTAGYNYISTHGDGTVNIYWKVENGNVTYKRLDPNSGSYVADEKLMTRSVPVSQLIEKYYATPQQQAQVNNDANQLKLGDN